MHTLTPADDFIPGSITDICGICHERFELQRDPRQYHTMETLEGELWDLICDECQDRIDAGDGTAVAAGDTDAIVAIIRSWPVLPEHAADNGEPCAWAGVGSEAGVCPDRCASLAA